MSPAAFERPEMVVCLISVSFDFDLGRAAATFFDLGWCRWWSITLGGSEESIPMPSDGEMRSSTREGCAGVSLLAAAISSRSAFANAPCESEMPTVVSARRWTTATVLRAGFLSSIDTRNPTPNRMRRPNNTILSMMLLHLKIVPVKIHRSMRQHGGGSRTTHGVLPTGLTTGLDVPDARRRICPVSHRATGRRPSLYQGAGPTTANVIAFIGPESQSQTDAGFDSWSKNSNGARKTPQMDRRRDQAADRTRAT
ncbi:hypothetical protein ABIF69_002664 [Bradyrhizobium japonicum]